MGKSSLCIDSPAGGEELPFEAGQEGARFPIRHEPGTQVSAEVGQGTAGDAAEALAELSHAPLVQGMTESKLDQELPPPVP